MGGRYKKRGTSPSRNLNLAHLILVRFHLPIKEREKLMQMKDWFMVGYQVMEMTKRFTPKIAHTLESTKSKSPHKN